MSYNALIIEKLEAEKYLATLLEKSASETGRQILKQAQLINGGLTRLTWYSSCMFENHQDVCEKLQKEDIRFIKAIMQLIKRRNLVTEMVEILINQMIGNLTDERIRNIGRMLTLRGANFTASTVSNRSFAYSIASGISAAFGTRASINSSLTKTATWATAITGLYGYVEIAADAAARLKSRNSWYYSALYVLELEMLYFLIESVINRVNHFNNPFKTDEEIATDILRMA